MATIETDRPGTVQGEVRMLIDGELVEAASGKRFDNVNPATEEVLGEVADASADDMKRAIAAARRAFDETDWSTNHAFRKKCLLQLQEAIESEKEELRHELVAEVGCPIALTYGPQLDAPLDDALTWPAEFIDSFEWRRELPDGHAFGGHSRRWVAREAAGVVGAIVPWNYPFEVSSQKIGQALATGNTVILKPAPDTPWNATRHRPPGRREDRHPAGRVQRRHVVRSPRRRGAHRRARSSTSSRSPVPPPPASASSRRAAPR